MKKYAIVVAGGNGTRMGSDIPKQFLELNGKPVLYYPMAAFFEAFNDVSVVLVLPKDHIDWGKEFAAHFFSGRKIEVTTGGSTRFHSVKNGLALVKEESVVFVHDGVRCLLSSDLIQRCYSTAIEKGSAIPVITSKDSVRLLNDEGSEVVNRDQVMLVQTPQTFLSRIILPAFNTEYQASFTDEATVVEAGGQKVFLLKGEERNIKITRPFDMLIAEKILSGLSDFTG